MALRRRKPVRFLVGTRRLCPGIERERVVGVALEGLVLGAERVALEVVRVEEVVLVVQGQRPESVDGWPCPAANVIE